jgi:hypothetical protein
MLISYRIYTIGRGTRFPTYLDYPTGLQFRTCPAELDGVSLALAAANTL